MSEFAMTISCRLNENDTTLTTIVLDTVFDNTINSTSTVTTHPIVNGDTIADHMFNNPNTLNVRGTFSLNGSKAFVVNGEGTYLENVQDMFEKIKREGILCEIVKVQIVKGNENTEEARFKRRSSMVLNNITWTERINSLDFSFGFTQALIADVQEYDVDIDDAFLPNCTEPETLNFTDTLIDWNVVDSAVIQALKDFDLITDEFLSFMSSLTATSLVALGVGLVVAKVIASISFVAPVVAIVGAVVAGAAILVKGIVNWFKGNAQKKKYRVEQFKKYKNDEKNRKEVQRFSNFIGEIHTQLYKLNDAIKVYAISANEPQECMLTIDNNYYIFTFTKNNTANKYSLSITDINDTVKGVLSDVTSAKTDISQCTSSNAIFRSDEGGSYIYLFCPDEDKTDLTNYLILVSSINMDEYNNAITDIIKNALTY